MDTRNGDIYASAELAKAAGVPDDRLVTGSPEAVADLSARLKALDQRGSFKNLSKPGEAKDEPTDRT